MIEEKVGRTSVFHLRLQIMNPWSGKFSGGSLFVIDFPTNDSLVKLARVFGWRAADRKWLENENEGDRKEMRMPLWRRMCGHLFRLEGQAFTHEKFTGKCSPRYLYRATIFLVRDNFWICNVLTRGQRLRMTSSNKKKKKRKKINELIIIYKMYVRTNAWIIIAKLISSLTDAR